MIRILDKGNGLVLQKVISPKGKTLRYQTVPEVRAPFDNDQIEYHPTLMAARQRIGKGELSGVQ